MTRRMLIDGSHAEEARVVVLDGNRLEDFDVETATKKQLKGNIYLAKIVRVEPSLQAAFVEYGGNRHGFLAFGEIHPDYYQIPVADRQRLIALQEQEAREAEAEEDAAAEAAERRGARPMTRRDARVSDSGTTEPGTNEPSDPDEGPDTADEAGTVDETGTTQAGGAQAGAADAGAEAAPKADESAAEPGEDGADEERAAGSEDRGAAGDEPAEPSGEDATAERDPGADADEAEALPAPEILGGEASADGADERERRPPPSRFMRNYKIQEVIKRRQILLVQVVKEERGGKGAALTTYISLAGRFCVLMPNSPRGGGVSRKITSATDRRRLREITSEIGLPSGMGLIVRTAGAARPKPEIVRDCEYLLDLWDEIRDTTLKSVAPALIYEEASLIRRAIRDLYARDIEEVLVDGEAAFRAARDQMRLLMPSHAEKVRLWQDQAGISAFARHQVDAQLDAMFSPTVQLKSGGYLVINQTEALVAIDVNSGRSTRERNIEETALRTNLEAADEVARQLRLRDLAGLIVIDFIDMEARRHNGMVEKRLKDALKHDRARIQLGSISHFGLMEMSRQRLRPSLAETSFVSCPHCAGSGQVRSTDGAAIQALRAVEEEAAKRRSAEILVHVPAAVALYVLNHKRDRLREIEARTGMVTVFATDASLLPGMSRIERVRALEAGEAPAESPSLPAPAPAPTPAAVAVADSAEPGLVGESQNPPSVRRGMEAEAGAAAEAPGEAGGRRRRRRRRRGGRGESGRGEAERGDAGRGELAADGTAAEAADPDGFEPAEDGEDASEALAQAGAPSSRTPAAETGLDPEAGAAGGEAGGRRRGRRGGRRRREGGAALAAPVAASAAAPAPAPVAAPELIVRYSGPTPADPFGGGGFDIFAALEEAEAAIAARPAEKQVEAPKPPAAAKPAAAALDLVRQAAPVAAADVVPEAAPDVAPSVPEKRKRVARPRKPRTTAGAELALTAAPEPVPEPVPEPAAPPVIEPTPAPKPVTDPVPPPVTDPVPVPVTDPVPDPAPVGPQPVVVADAPATARRGWWKR